MKRMKASDEEEYGAYYGSRTAANRYRYNEYSPSRSHHHPSSSSALVDHYSMPPPGHSTAAGSTGRSYTRTPPYPGSGRTLNEYAAPPCCHQFYHPPGPPMPLHQSPSHFNTIPHPPLPYRDTPACSTLNRSCYSRRSNNNPYNTYYTTDSPYADPRNEIYYTSTLTRNPRHSASGVSQTGRNLAAYHEGMDGGKIYEPPPPPALPPPSVYQHPRAYAPSVAQHPPPGTSSLLRIDEPRLYSSSAIQLTSSNNAPGTSSMQRSSSPQNHQHYMDRSISLIRLDNSNAAASGSPHASAMPSTSEARNPAGTTSGGTSIALSTTNPQTKFVIKFTPEMQSQQHQSNASSLVKTSIELGSSNDPLAGASSMTPNKPKFKINTLENAHHTVQNKPVVEMLDKCVMTTQLPEQWSLVSSTGSDGRRISVGATSPPGASPSPAPTLAGGVPDLLPSCVVRNPDFPTSSVWRSSGSGLISSPRRNMYPGPSGSHDPTSSASCVIGGPSSSSASMMPGSSRSSGIPNVSYSQPQCMNAPHPSTSGGAGARSSHPSASNTPPKESKWSIVRKYMLGETKTFFGLKEDTDLKDEWLSRRKRFASRRYSERNVDSMPPPSPYHLPNRVGPPGSQYRQPQNNFGAGGPVAYDQIDHRISTFDQRPGTSGASGRSTSSRNRRTRKKDNVFVVYWNLLRWIFWSIRFGRTGQRVAAGSGCGSDTNPGAGSISPGRVPLHSQMSRDRTKSRSFSPTTLSEIPPSITVSPHEYFFDDLDDNYRNSTHHLQPPGRGLHWRIARTHPSAGGLLGSNRIPAQFLNKILDNSERQQFRQGLRQPTSTISKLGVIDEYEDFRPYFTYWITIVQIIILISTMIIYGMAPVGWDLHRKSSLVLVTSLSLQQIEVIQPANFWIGPSAGDLIHLGAKYAPCMRLDEAIYRRIIETRDRERETACCIRNDNSGCVQSSRNECSGLLSRWKKWTRDDSPGGRISGSVCGLDPKFCEAPASIAPYEWPDDITKWPICRKTRGLSGIATRDKTAEHMVCEVIGHPCCIGIHAKCLITTREYCRFVNGYFHEEASLCSQVSCLQDVCGMFPFLAHEQPDQFYRLISSLFLHAGLIHILFTLIFHWFIMRDLEKLAGPLRIACIYLGSGIAGNLGSVLLEPHRAEVGPGGGQYGLLACLLVELLHMWSMLRRPWQALGKMVLVTGGLFLIGFLPWVDNFAHAVGFIVGFLLSHALMPYVSFGKYSSYRKWLEVVICLSGYLAILVTLLIIFYIGFGDCELCHLLNCLPLTKEFCAEQDIDFRPSGGGFNLIT